MTETDAENRIQQLEQRVAALEAELATLRSKPEGARTASESAHHSAVLQADRLLSEVRNRWVHLAHSKPSHEPAEQALYRFIYPEATQCLSRRRVLTERLNKYWRTEMPQEASEWKSSQNDIFVWCVLVFRLLIEERDETPKRLPEETPIE